MNLVRMVHDKNGELLVPPRAVRRHIKLGWRRKDELQGEHGPETVTPSGGQVVPASQGDEQKPRTRKPRTA